MVIQVKDLSMTYRLYDNPKDRLKEVISPVKKKYHRLFYALRDINFSVAKGDVVGILGKNGAGKSTLLKIIAGILHPSSGTVSTQGKIAPLLELGSGFNPEFSGLENIYFYATINEIPKDKIDGLVDSIIQFSELGEFIHQPLKNYSSGMRARLAFSVSTAIKPEILILDEILSVGDIYFRRKSFAKMNSLIKGGTTVLFVSHSPQSIIQICNRAIMLRDGELLLDGSSKNVVKLYQRSLDSNIQIGKKDLQDQLEQLENPISDKASSKSINNQLDKFQKSKNKQLTNNRISTSEFKNKEISLKKVSIIDNDKQGTHTLIHGRKYDILIEFLFSESVNDVVFPIAIYTTNGLLLSGIRYPDDQTSIASVHDGQCVNICWGFSCYLLPGKYFLTVGVTSIENGYTDFVYRVEDAYLFEVIDLESKVHWGHFTLKQHMKNFLIE